MFMDIIRLEIVEMVGVFVKIEGGIVLGEIRIWYFL